MARTFLPQTTACPAVPRSRLGFPAREGEGAIYFRALVDLDTGGVAAIEPALARHIRCDVPPGRGGVVAAWLPRPGTEALGAWGREVREPAAYLVRASLATRIRTVGRSLGVAPEKVILMFAVTELRAQPTAALECLIAGKRAGARILLDHIDLAEPPARFLEMLPADILRVVPARLPWHWEEDRRESTMASLMAFAGNLLMDVAVEGVESDGQRRAFKRLGVRYAQGGWRRDHLGLVPDPAGL
jgi:predicted signal transduction protein with EAL and GGDEF domain